MASISYILQKTNNIKKKYISIKQQHGRKQESWTCITNG